MEETKRGFVASLDAVITKINEILLIVAMSVMFLFVFANVVGRYCFSYTYIWVDELSRYLMISGAFLGMGLAMRQSRHSAFYIAQNLLPDKPRKIVRVLVAAIIYGMMLLLLVLGAMYASRSMNNLTEALRWPVGYWYCVIPLGAFLFIWHFTMIFIEYINAPRDSDIEKEIAEGDALTGDSEFMKKIDVEKLESLTDEEVTE